MREALLSPFTPTTATTRHRKKEIFEQEGAENDITTAGELAVPAHAPAPERGNRRSWTTFDPTPCLTTRTAKRRLRNFIEAIFWDRRDSPVKRRFI